METDFTATVAVLGRVVGECGTVSSRAVIKPDSPSVIVVNEDTIPRARLIVKLFAAISVVAEGGVARARSLEEINYCENTAGPDNSERSQSSSGRAIAKVYCRVAHVPTDLKVLHDA